MTLNAKDVAAILQALEGSTFDTLDLEMEGVKLQLRRSTSVAAPSARSAAPRQAQSATYATGLAGAATAPPGAAAAPIPAVGTPTPVEVPPGTAPVTAPLLGVFYRAPKPGEPAFVEVGSRVDTQTIVGIIEVMKLMNSVRAGVSGEVVSIAARNGELVEYGEALLFVRPD